MPALRVVVPAKAGRRIRRFCCLAAVIFCCAAAGSAGASAAHPLDALSAEEIAIATAVLREAGQAGLAIRFPLITLDEPDKPALLAWQPGQVFARKAFVIAR